MYQIKIPSSVKKDIKRLDKPVQREIRDKHFPEIKKNPYQAKPLRGKLKGIWAYHFSYRATQYRIAYEIYPEEQMVLLVMRGKRGDFYEALLRQLGLW